MKIALVGAPVSFGGNALSTELGPDALRATGLVTKLQTLGHEVLDIGDIEVPRSTRVRRSELRPYFLDEVVTQSQKLMEKVRKAAAEGYFPLILGGDHTVSIGSAAGSGSIRKRMGLVYFDAHADFNITETSPTGNLHGMVLSAILGYVDRKLASIGHQSNIVEENVVAIGVRSIDPPEERQLARSRITVIRPEDIRQAGLEKAVEKAIKIATNGVDAIHLSFDIDVLDPTVAPATGTPIPGGLMFDECRRFMTTLGNTRLIQSMDIVELNPKLDMASRSCDALAQLIFTFMTAVTTAS